MTTVAFDLDGVFIPDCDNIPNLGGLKEFYELTCFMRPIFVPVYDKLVIITARREKYRHLTQQWIDRYFSEPVVLFHSIHDDETPAQYKARILNHTENDNIQLYVESDITIVNELRITTTKQILHFSEYISKNLQCINY